jgi:hypothetical protein
VDIGTTYATVPNSNNSSIEISDGWWNGVHAQIAGAVHTYSANVAACRWHLVGTRVGHHHRSLKGSPFKVTP